MPPVFALQWPETAARGKNTGMSASSFSDQPLAMHADDEPIRRSSRFVVGARWLFEVTVITALFAAAGSWPVPDTNEAHYLTKARHAVDPSWCPDDFFLSTGDAHVVFFRLVGPLAAARPLEEVAWIGRLLGWLLLAIAVRQVAAVVIDREPGSAGWRGSLWHVLAAALFSLLVRVTPASGEWVIGGFESKVLAWAGVILATAAVAAGRFGWAWLACGMAAAVHPVVGLWGFGEVGCVACWRLCVGISRGVRGEPLPVGEPGGSRQLLTGLVGGVAGAAVASLGVLPAVLLGKGVDPALAAEAARIQVQERLPHHLWPASFQQLQVVTHLLAVGLMLVAWAAARPSPRLGRVVGMAVASLFVSATGLVIASLRDVDPAMVDQLLRFYWFRSADGLVPLAAAVLVVDWFRWGTPSGVAISPQRTAAVGVAFVFALAAVTWDLVLQRDHWPQADGPQAARSERHVDELAWREACAWIRDNTPQDAVFLTPRGAATFTWWTSRAEVVSWKNMPQDPESVVAWRRRIFDLFAPDGSDSLKDLERSTASFGEDRVRAVAQRYGAEYIIVPRKVIDELGEPLPSSEQGYIYSNEGYSVYSLAGQSNQISQPINSLPAAEDMPASESDLDAN